MDEELYDIIRFRKDGSSECIESDVTLDRAKEHCNDPESHGEDWFDGWRKS